MSQTKAELNINQALATACESYAANDYAGCELLCWQIVGFDSAVAEAWHLLGSCAFKQGHHHAAFGLMRRSIDLDGDSPAYMTNFAEVLLAIEETQLAREACDRAIELNPQLAEAYNNLGLALDRIGDVAGAEKALKKAEQLDPTMAAAYINRLTVLGRLGQSDFAIEHGLKALEVFPDVPEVRWNLSLLMLKAGRWMEAWPHYQYRWMCSKFPSPRWQFVQPHWNGAKFDGTLLVHAEQGHGDTIMLSRYLRMIRPHVRKIVWHVQPGLGELCKLIAPWAEVADWGTTTHFDRHVAMMDLPWIFETTAERIPPPAPVKLNLIGMLPAGFKIGYCYNGSSIHANNANRSATVDDFEPLKEIGATLVNLTHGKQPIDGSVDPMPMVRDWVTTAHIIAELDLVVTVDTAVAHLAATLGKPVVCLLPAVNVDWRWLDEGETTAWYPSMRLVRRGEGQSWREVVAGVVDEMRDASIGDRLIAVGKAMSPGGGIVLPEELAVAV